MKILNISFVLLFVLKAHFVNLHAGSGQDYYLWHWHMKLELDEGSKNQLLKLPAKGFFFRSAHFRYPNQKVKVVPLKKRSGFEKRIQRFGAFEEFHLAYSFSNSGVDRFVRDYLNKKPTQAIEIILGQIRKDVEFFSIYLKNLKGIQIDLEGAGVDFKIFTDLLKAIKAKFPRLILSITPMSSWWKKDGFQAVADASDLVVPMLYDFHRGRKTKDPLKVTDLKWFQKIVKNWDSINRPLLLGVPTYSYCVIYDDKGKMKIPWALVSPERASENPYFLGPRLSYNSSGWKDKITTKDRLISYTTGDDMLFSNIKFMKGARLKYNFLSVSALSELLGSIENTKLKNSRGIAFFRYGVPGEALVLDAYRLSKAIKKNFYTKESFKIYRKDSPSGTMLILKNGAGRSYFGKVGLKLELENVKSDFLDSDFDHYEVLENGIKLKEEYLTSREFLVSPILKVNPDSKLKLHLELSNGMSYQMQKKISEIEAYGH